MFHLISLLCVLGLVGGQMTIGQQCTENAGNMPIDAYIEGCFNPPCILPQLEYVNLHIFFQAPHTITTMKTLATAFMFIGAIGIPIHYDLGDQAITCNFLKNTECPIAEGEYVQYTLNKFIESFTPVGTTLTVEFYVVDQDSNPVLCVRVPIQFANPRVSRSETSINGTSILV